MKIWLAIIIGSVAGIGLLWWSSLPLGVPGEWTWERPQPEPDLLWNLVGGSVAAGLLIAYVILGWQRLEVLEKRSRYRLELALWLMGLVAFSFAWLWVVQEVSPIQNRLGKSAFVLYFASSSGYFERARYEEPRPMEFLAGYEELMRQGDVLHTGTHPPGLFLIFHGLIAACEASAELSTFLDVTQPSSFREACDVIATNTLRRRVPRQLLPLDRRVLWLATLLVMLCAVLTILPLYGLLRRHVGVSTAWLCSALWPAIPAVAIFVPKSDSVFPLISAGLLWLWLTAWDRRSPFLAVLAGGVTWCGLVCSLAFLPVLLAVGLLTVGSAMLSVSAGAEMIFMDRPQFAQPTVGLRRWLCLMAGAIGFATPTYLIWRLAKINLLNVWWLNYQNHAGFYQHYSRTYWKWLLLNPLELACAAGWPVALLAFVACVSHLRRFRGEGTTVARTDHLIVVGCISIVWGLLWLTGKNSGEAARLWILFMPWLIWLSSFSLESMLGATEPYFVRRRRAVALLVIQFLVCLLTVAGVSGFHTDTGS